MSNKNVIIYLVHGTFDNPKPDEPHWVFRLWRALRSGRICDKPKPNVSHWSDPDGKFAKGVKAQLPEDLQTRITFEPFIWTGENSFEARKNAVDRLVSVIEAEDDRLRLFIGHSHGGTVIADALVAARKPNVSGVLTLATPFVAQTLNSSAGRLGMAMYAPMLAVWVAFSGALASAYHQAWIATGLCVAATLFSLLGFVSKRIARWAAILGSLAILIVPLAFALLAFWNSSPFGTFAAVLLGVFILILFTAEYWAEWASAKVRDFRGIPSETELPKAPKVPLMAFRLPGDEASFAIVAAQALVWFETESVNRSLWWLKSKVEKRTSLTFPVVLVVWACCCGGVALVKHPDLSWWFIPIYGFVLMVIGSILLLIILLLLLLWLRVLTTLLLAAATGIEVLFGMGAVNVYAEPLPRWRSHARCHLEILGWTKVAAKQMEEDAKQMPSLRHSMHRLGFVHKRVACWIAKRMKEGK